MDGNALDSVCNFCVDKALFAIDTPILEPSLVVRTSCSSEATEELSETSFYSSTLPETTSLEAVELELDLATLLDVARLCFAFEPEFDSVEETIAFVVSLVTLLVSVLLPFTTFCELLLTELTVDLLVID